MPESFDASGDWAFLEHLEQLPWATRNHTLDYGRIRIDGTSTVDGDKITMRPTVGETSQTMVFTTNIDDSIDGPPGSDITKLRKAK